MQQRGSLAETNFTMFHPLFLISYKSDSRHFEHLLQQWKPNPFQAQGL